MTPTLLETLMYDVGQLFLLPTLALIGLLFLYAFWALGEFITQGWQRRRHGIETGRGYVLVAFALRHRIKDPDTLDVTAHRLLEWPRIATRVAPMLGLVATMIPMGPALKGLSGGNLANVGENLTIAFSAVILALIAASITFWVVNVRRRWLAEELVWLGKHQPQWEVDA
ncbi:MotA/TolQ/ExbB proton channel family protein [Cupriavidus basilensis]|uniref:MotA/TolQ/ExbB proton channel family protein n=1 Tax=Cupriavidus basilensis TaxID=68895 RepID=UPI001D3F11E4|nr:MotA/TolQ/ExbB proton channel family protein [Cupriavidus basilensis]NUA27378.1 MotA/TolQ/ExbB proton channel family protein [Cupriavidus basilensis]